MARLVFALTVTALLTVALWPVLTRPAIGQVEGAASAWVQFGDPDQENGLRLRAGQSASLASRGGRLCRGTEGGRRRWFLSFTVDPEFIQEPMPARVTVEYWDEGTDWFDLHYDSTNASLQSSDARSEIVRRTDTKTWKHYTFHLPDAAFGAAGFGSSHFYLYLEPWDQHDRFDDLLVSRVEVTKGGLFLRADPDAVPADGATTCALRAKIYDRSGAPVADGTPVTFSSTLGRVTPPQATTVGGVASATFTGATHPGTASVTARWSEDEQTIRIPMLAGRGPLREISFTLDDFSDPDAWRSTDTPEAAIELSTRDVPRRNGHPTARLTYRFGTPAAQHAASIYRPTMIPGRPRELALWIESDGSGNQFDAYWHDATGREFYFNSVFLWGQGWDHTLFRLRAPMISVTEQDYAMSYPLTFDRFRLLQTGWSRAGVRGDTGTLHLQSLVVTTQVPESSLVWPELLVEGGHLVGEPGQRVTVSVRVRSFLEQRKRGLKLNLSALDSRGEATPGPRYELDLGAGESKTFAWPLVPNRTGRFRLEARVEGEGVYAVSHTEIQVGLAGG